MNEQSSASTPFCTSVKYIPYRNTRTYIQQQYQAVPKKPGKRYPEHINVWMLLMGYKNKSKFLRRMLEQWLFLWGKIPMEFLCLIEVDIDVLKQMLDLDKAEYLAALSKIPVPNHFILRLMPAVYSEVALPDNLSTIEAIKFVQNYLSNKPKALHKACINFGGLKTIFVTPTDYFGVFNEPEMTIYPNHVEFERMPPYGVSFIR